MLDFTSEAVRAFTKDLSIRKIPGVGRVNERLLEAIGIKVRQAASTPTQRTVSNHTLSDMW